MTSEVAVQTQVLASPRRVVAPVIALGWREAKRVLASPVYVAVLLFMLATGGLGSVIDGSLGLPTAAAAYEFVFYLTALYAGLLTYMAAHLVTSSSRRTHADRQLAASPVSTRERGGGVCLGVICGPGGVALVLMLLLAWLGTSVVALPEDSNPFSVVELSQIALTIIGGGLFGVLTATWLRFPGSLPIGLVVLVFGTVLLLDPPRGPANTLPWLAPWGAWFDEAWTLTGSQEWHAAYLVGLCLLAFCGVMLREREGRGRWLAISAAVFAGTVIVGWAQL